MRILMGNKIYTIQDLEIKIKNTKDKHYHDFNLKVYTENFISNVN